MKNKKFIKKTIMGVIIALSTLFLIATAFSQILQPIKADNSDYRIPVPDSGNILFFNDNTGETLFSINHNGEFIWNVGTSVGKGILSAKSYDSENNRTLIEVIGGNFTEAGIKDATTINVLGEVFYVDSIINDTALYGLGELTFSDASNWNYRINAYFDIAGIDTDERGYSISKNGLWQWAMYSPSSTKANENNFCIASRNNSFADLMCAKQEGIIEYYSPIQLSPTIAKSICSELTRGSIYYLRGETGQDDKVQVCTKDSSDNYDWKNLSLT
jgi:hypothetical protein